MATKLMLPSQYVITGVEVLESQTLGQGSYGVVYLGRYCGLLCAVKKLKGFFTAKDMDQVGEIVLQSFYNESEKLCKLRHPNIIQLLGLYTDKYTQQPVIVMELMHESLSRLLHRTESLPLYVEVNILHDVVLALAYLHTLDPPIIHRDLSSNNILLSKDFRAKITDLGVAKVENDSFLNTPAPGTLSYMPPEVRKIPADLSPAMDMFAVGVNLLQILTHKFPSPGPELTSGVLGFTKMVPEKERRREHLDLVGKSHILRSILLHCLKDSAKDRPTALKLCEQVEKLKTGKSYLESFEVANVQVDQMVAAMQRIATLEKTNQEISQKLVDKTLELEKISRELKEEREYTEQLLNERARAEVDKALNHYEKLPIAEGPASPDTNPTNMQKKKKRLLFNLKRYRRNTSPAVFTTNQGAICDSTPISDAIGDEDEEPYDLDEEIETNIASPLEAYKQRQLTWSSHKCLPVGLQGSTLQMHHCDERLYLCGGALENSSPNKSVFCSLIDCIDQWEQLRAHPPQYHCASVVVHSDLVLIGGLDSTTNRCTGILSSYDYQVGAWMRRLPAMPTPRASATAFVTSDYVIVIGGQKKNGKLVNIVEVLHVPSSRWEVATPLPESMAGQSVAVCGDMVYLIGGINQARVPSTSVYVASIPQILSSCHFFSFLVSTDNNGRIWKQLSDCPYPLMTAISFEDQIFVLGGQEITNASEQPAAILWCLNQEENTWTPVQELPSARQLCCATILPDYTLVIAGGLPHFTTVDIAKTSC